MSFFRFAMIFSLMLASVYALGGRADLVPRNCCFCFFQPGQPSNFEGACKLWESAQALGLSPLPNSCEIIQSYPMDDTIGYAPVGGVRALQRDAFANLISANVCSTTTAMIAHHAYANLGNIEISDIVSINNKLNVNILFTDLGCESAQSFNNIDAAVNLLMQHSASENTEVSFTGSQSATGSHGQDGSTFNETTGIFDWKGTNASYSYALCNLGGPCVLGYDTTAMCTQVQQGISQFAQEKCCHNTDPNPPEGGWGGGHWVLGSTCP